MPATKFIRVAVEGATCDGRNLERQDIADMASTYDPKKYGARIWMEHFRGLYPDSAFKAFGDVLEAKAEEVEIDGAKKLALFVKLDVTEDLIEVNKKRQKIYTSIEIMPNFAKSGKAYLFGLAVTDTPASLGTEALKLFSSRKQDADNLFTVGVEAELELDEEPKSSLGAELFNKVKALITKATQSTENNFSGVSQAVELIATSQKDLLAQFSEQSKTVETLNTALTKAIDDLAKITKDYNDLYTKLEKEPGNTVQRPAATGSDGQIKTDC